MSRTSKKKGKGAQLRRNRRRGSIRRQRTRDLLEIGIRDPNVNHYSVEMLRTALHGDVALGHGPEGMPDYEAWVVAALARISRHDRRPIHQVEKDIRGAS